MSLQENLSHLFLTDQQLRGLRARLDSANNRYNIQNGRAQQLQQQCSELGQQAKGAQVGAQAAESDLLSIDAKVNHLREHMNAAKTNKEYSALLVEVNSLKVDKKAIEEVALAQMGKAEELAAQLKLTQEKHEQQLKLVAVAKAEVDRCRVEIGAQLDELSQKREAAAQEVPQEVRDLFDRLADAYEGEALAEVHEQNRKDMEYTCGGCYMSIPIERVNALMTRPNELVLCPGCRRILYLGQDLRSSISSPK